MATLVQLMRLLAVIQPRVTMMLSKPMVLVLLGGADIEDGFTGGVGAEAEDAEVEEVEAEKDVKMSPK